MRPALGVALALVLVLELALVRVLAAVAWGIIEGSVPVVAIIAVAVVRVVGVGSTMLSPLLPLRCACVCALPSPCRPSGCLRVPG